MLGAVCDFTLVLGALIPGLVVLYNTCLRVAVFLLLVSYVVVNVFGKRV